MSLKAWYPFNGNQNNQGIGDLNLTQTTTPTYELDGKVCEKALSSGGFKWTAAQTASILNNQELSIAFWIKPLNSNNSNLLFGNGGMNPPNNRKFSIFTYPTVNDFHWSWQNDDSNTTFTGGVVYNCFPTNIWTHCCITYKNPNCSVYINGIKVSESTGISNSTFNFETQVITSDSNRLIQDFRIYDNCLSPREVKQLARGLSLHYKLDSIIKNPNLITSMSSGGRTTVFGKYGLNADFSYPGADTYGYFNVSPSLEPNKQYTLSFDVFDFPSQSVWGWSLWNDSNYSFLVKKTGHYKYTFFAPEQTGQNLSRFLFDDKGRTNPQGIVKFRNFKIEEGSRDTGWCPHESNSDSTEIDCSGYLNNGTRIGIHTSGDDSLRYKKSRVFNNNQYISKSRISNSNSTTISIWLKINSYPTDNIVAFADDVSKVAFGFYNNGSAIISCGSGNNTTPIVLNLKEKWTVQDWHMVTVVKNNNEYKFYLDGQLWSSYGSSNYWTTSIQNLLTIGCRNNGSYANFFSGQMSDFRIYETALNDKDIAELYNVATSYTKENSLLTYEINETESVDNIKYGKNDVKANSFTEIGYIDGMKIKVLPDKSAWARIHWLDVTGRETEKETTGRNPYFNSNEEVAFCDEVNRFSKMGLVDHFKNNDGVYEFMLTHPKISEVDYNRWTQTSSPNKTTVTGFTSITAAWPQAHGGIRKHGTAAVYDCDTGDTWYAPIGQKSQWTTGKHIPAANETSTTEIELWVRIDNLPKVNKISMFNNTIQASHIKEL